ADRDAQRKRNLFVAQPIDFAQDDRRPLIERQTRKRMIEAFGELFLRKHPVRRHLAAGLEFAVGRDVLIERHLVGPMTTAPEPMAVTGLIDGDAIDPGAKAGLAPKAVNGAKNPQEDFLGKVEGFV